MAYDYGMDTGSYSPAMDSQQANVDMGQGSATGLTPQQKQLAAQMLMKLAANSATAQTPQMTPTLQANRSGYVAGPGTVNTMGGR